MKDFMESWQDPAWRLRANQWTRDALAAHGLRVSGELAEIKVRPWSIVLQVPTDTGQIYFKATPPDSAYETPLTEKLAAWLPQNIPQVLAVEHAEGWWLARDGGESIRDRLKATRDLGEWQAAVTLYARMQMELAARVEEMRALGVSDRRPHTLPALYNALLNDPTILRVGEDKGITAEQEARLRDLSAPLAEWCAQLEASKIPNSLHHGDLNSENVLKQNGRYGFVDWGDASLAHPFSSLRTPLVSIEIALELPDYDPATAPVRDAYLSAWRAYDSVENLHKTYALAQRLSSIVSALSWYRGIVVMSPEVRQEYHHIVPALLQEFADAPMDAYPFV